MTEQTVYFRLKTVVNRVDHPLLETRETFDSFEDMRAFAIKQKRRKGLKDRANWAGYRIELTPFGVQYYKDHPERLDVAFVQSMQKTHVLYS